MNVSYFGSTRSTCVCWSMNSLTMTPHGVRDGCRHGRSRAAASYQSVTARCRSGAAAVGAVVARVDGVLTVAVVPVSGTLDLKTLAAAAGGRKAVMAEPADAERTTGYVLGGISPLGQKKALPTVVDESALTFATVMVSAGKRGLQVELPPAELVRLTRARTAPIGR